MGQKGVLGAQGHPGLHSKASLGFTKTLSEKSKTNKTLKLKTRDWQDSFSQEPPSPGSIRGPSVVTQRPTSPVIPVFGEWKHGTGEGGRRGVGEDQKFKVILVT